MSQGKLAGKLCIVTGAGRGLGAAVAEAYGREGAHVIASARTREDIEGVAGRIVKAGGRADAVPVDVRDEASVRDLMRTAADLGHGRIDVLVNNAGVFVHAARFPRMDSADWDRCFDTNLKGAYLCAKHALPHMDVDGRILNVTSGLAHGPSLLDDAPSAGYAPYSVSKLALEGLTKALAQRMGPRVNAINPGVVRTPMSHGLGVPPETIAPSFVWLASADAADVTGRIFRADDILRDTGSLRRRPRIARADGVIEYLDA